ncbi:hypothetical protein [Mameliella sediminis]|uniref:hypothetical protein n=1 Tax=Mameliella sediminis TaxID=2836866 RepID=UPI001C459150|nr:hypothetical protein [Mameliella sediminis]MBV7396569.1 hypothetical protein [Mameliella sediminis]
MSQDHDTKRAVTSHVEKLREDQITQMINGTGTVAGMMQVWLPNIQGRFDQGGRNASALLELGESLSEIFAETTTAGRSQSTLSAGGNAWETLVCYYLNLCLIGSNSIVIKKRSLVPTVVQKALTVSYGNTDANTESDLVCINFPDDPTLYTDLRSREKLTERLNSVADSHWRDLSVLVVQTKTNWNDNAQIPMLWDMVYQGAPHFGDVQVGTGTKFFGDKKSDEAFAQIRYAFVTVPTNKSVYKPTSMPVERVRNLSGGNYWGKPSQKGIAKSLDRIFVGARLGSGEGALVSDTVSRQLSQLSTTYSYFGLK